MSCNVFLLFCRPCSQYGMPLAVVHRNGVREPLKVDKDKVLDALVFVFVCVPSILPCCVTQEVMLFDGDRVTLADFVLVIRCAGSPPPASTPSAAIVPVSVAAAAPGVILLPWKPSLAPFCTGHHEKRRGARGGRRPCPPTPRYHDPKKEQE